MKKTVPFFVFLLFLCLGGGFYFGFPSTKEVSTPMEKSSIKKPSGDLVLLLTAKDEARKTKAEETGDLYVDNVHVISLIAALPGSIANFDSAKDAEDYISGKGSTNGSDYMEDVRYTKNYAMPDNKVWATVSVYHLGMRNLKDGIDSFEAQKAFWNMLERTHSMKKIMYPGLKETFFGTATVEGVPFRKYVFECGSIIPSVVRPKKVEQYITVYRKAFLRIQASYYSKEETDGEAKISRFMTTLVKNLTAEGGKRR